MTHPIRAAFLSLSLALCLALPGVASADDEDVAALMQLVDYIAVDYPAAVEGGQVISDAEYAEMREFSTRAAELAAGLQGSPLDARIAAAARTLVEQVGAKADVGELRRTIAAMRGDLQRAHPLPGAPRVAPDLAAAARLYAVRCAACHGASGRGDGPQGVGLEPAPTDFTDAARAEQRSLSGLHSTISRGIDGTAMAAFVDLADAERWELAWYVGAMHAAADAGPPGPLPADLTLAAFTERTPAELHAVGVPASLVAALRRDPTPLYARAADPIAIARAKLADAAAAHAAGDAAGAYRAALAAYLDGFELAEPSLRAVAPERVVAVEREMLALREAIRAPGAAPLGPRFAALDADLAELGGRLADRDALEPATAFTASLFILLREGLEAILLVGLMVTVLIKTGRRDALRPVHQGWIAALVLGAATWAVSSWVIVISGATREMTEGVAALLAAAVLFYVGFWMHDKLAATRWQAFLREQVEGALASGSRWTLALLSFVAVYREVFETVLFYQALWVQAAPGPAQTAILLGAAAATLGLAALWWAVFHLGMRLPLRQFFGISAALMIGLAIVFAGKGIAALQEAGRVPFDALPLPQVELLGIYPTVQSLGLQLALLVLAAGLVLYNRRAEARAG